MVCKKKESTFLVMPIGNPWDRLFYPTLTLMPDPYNLKDYRMKESSNEYITVISPFAA